MAAFELGRLPVDRNTHFHDDLLTADQVARRVRRWVPGGSDLPGNWARSGRAIAMGTPDGRAFPRWQFDGAGLPYPVVGRVLEMARLAGQDVDVVNWFVTPNQELDGRMPRDCIEDADAVLEAAKAAFVAEMDAARLA